MRKILLLAVAFTLTFGGYLEARCGGGRGGRGGFFARLKERRVERRAERREGMGSYGSGGYGCAGGNGMMSAQTFEPTTPVDIRSRLEILPKKRLVETTTVAQSDLEITITPWPAAMAAMAIGNVPERFAPSYSSAQKICQEQRVPIVVGVGCAPPAGDAWVTCMVKKLDGYSAPCIVVAMPGETIPLWKATLKPTATAAQIKSKILLTKWNPYDPPMKRELQPGQRSFELVPGSVRLEAAPRAHFFRGNTSNC